MIEFKIIKEKKEHYIIKTTYKDGEIRTDYSKSNEETGKIVTDILNEAEQI